MWVIALHFGAGAVAGAMFNIRTLLVLVAVVVLECLAAGLANGLTAALYSVGGLVAVQAGYLAGIMVRGVLERAGLAQSSVRPEHQR
ncbi:hypothetical protein [Bradyrhizobium sp. HKCCYLR20261]|uniref:hypothetical protein n=1 Tax=Bradyrhizobium sp. HKCCYLR20261 TaxID=3420760 RepID=UPI003EB8F405